VSDLAPPYPPSWYDRLQTWIEDRAGPAWAFYLFVVLAIAIVLNVVVWLVGYVPPGTFDLYVNSGAAYVVIGYAGMHYLDTAARRAWTAFRPMTRLDEAEAERFAYELTTMPAGPALAATVLGVAISAVFVVSQYGRPFDLDDEPILFVASVVLVTLGFVGTIGTLYHSFHQLRLISRAHRFVDTIDPLNLEPLHAFARVTGATGIVLLAIAYLAIPTNPLPLGNPAVVVTTVAANVLAIACFVVPLVGMHDAIAAEKAGRLARVNGLLADGLTELHGRVEQRDLSDADALNKQLSSLLAEREVIISAPTWPWAPQTLRGFSAAIVIPIGLWLIYRFLERAL
jgi:hypothetical protein